jgi:hypothetical protein
MDCFKKQHGFAGYFGCFRSGHCCTRNCVPAAEMDLETTSKRCWP